MRPANQSKLLSLVVPIIECFQPYPEVGAKFVAEKTVPATIIIPSSYAVHPCQEGYVRTVCRVRNVSYI